MKWSKTLLLLLFPLFISSIRGQVNLTLNYSFELQNSCGDFGATCLYSTVYNWYDPTYATPDLLAPCHTGSYGEPQNYAGWQYARTGISYAGIASGTGIPYREYITGILFDTLKANSKYCVTFYTSLADSLWWATGALGAYFSNDKICDSLSQTILPYTPQIENPLSNILTDKVNWVSISGEFQAMGGEQFITIGNFYSDALTNYTFVGNGGLYWTSHYNTYYYIDDVSVRELTIANAAISANGKKIDTICPFNSVQIGKDTTTSGVSFHWSPNYNLSNADTPQPWASPSVTTTYTLTVVNDSVHGCNCPDSVTRDSVTVVVNTCVGINNLRFKNYDLRIEPNPNNGVFAVSGLEENMKIDIYNYMGELINSFLSKSSFEDFDISNKPDGVYLIRVTQDGWLVGQRKVIVNR